MYNWQSFWHLHTIIMYTFGLYTLALSPCSLFPFADSLLLPFFNSLHLLGTLLAAIGSVHPGPRLLVNWSPHIHPSLLLPICSPSVSHSEIPTLWGSSKLNAPFTKTTSKLWFPRPAQFMSMFCWWGSKWNEANEPKTLKDRKKRNWFSPSLGNTQTIWTELDESSSR